MYNAWLGGASAVDICTCKQLIDVWISCCHGLASDTVCWLFSCLPYQTCSPASPAATQAVKSTAPLTTWPSTTSPTRQEAAGQTPMAGCGLVRFTPSCTVFVALLITHKCGACVCLCLSKLWAFQTCNITAARVAQQFVVQPGLTLSVCVCACCGSQMRSEGPQYWGGQSANIQFIQVCSCFLWPDPRRNVLLLCMAYVCEELCRA